MSLSSSRRKAADAFWSHWSKVASAGAPDRDSVEDAVDEGIRLLGKYDDALGLEVYVDDADQHALLLTAYGNADHLSSVEALASRQPTMTGLPVLVLRPPGNPDFELEIEGQKFSASKIWFSILRDDSNPAFLGLDIFFPRDISAPDDALFMAATLMVQTLIGERAFMEKIGLLRLGDRRADPEKFVPLARLVQLIEREGGAPAH